MEDEVKMIKVDCLRPDGCTCEDLSQPHVPTCQWWRETRAERMTDRILGTESTSQLEDQIRKSLLQKPHHYFKLPERPPRR
jgi:hypothetical protein